MSKQLKILLVEDKEVDALLIVHELKRSGFQVTYSLVDTLDSFQLELVTAPWDVIFCGHHLPALDALEILKQANLEIPFIVYANAADNDTILEALRAGVDDFLLIDNLSRLVIVVEKEIRNARARAAKQRSDVELLDLLKTLSSLKFALDQSSLVSITDSEGMITYVNDRFCHVSKYTNRELVGQDHRIINSGHHSPEFFKELWDTISAGKVWRGDIKNKAKDNSYFWVNTVITPLLDTADKPFKYLAIYSEISQRKAYEEELIAAKEKAEADNKAKSVFLANTSHEIRNPMNGIIGMSNILGRTQLTVEQRKYLNLIQLSSEKMMSIINDILDFSKMEAGKLQMHNMLFNLDEFIEETIALSLTSAQQKGLELIAEVEDCQYRNFVGDSDRLRQVLINLLQNGIKFTDQGYVKLKVNCQPISGDRCKLTFAIIDTGIGIKAEDIKHLFQPFFQLDSFSKNHEGTGLGLAIVKKLVEMMNGKISVESEYGCGSTFSVEVELLQAVEKPEQEQATLVEEPIQVLVQEKISNIKVLIAEDNAINRMHLSLLLGDKGYKTFEVTNGLDALKLYEQERFDVILMDGQMPHMDGFLAIEKIREMEKSSRRRTPIIALSGYANDSDKNKFYQAGVDEFVSKPVSENELFEKIRALIE